MGSQMNQGILELRISQSPVVTVAATILIKTSCALGAGFATS